MLHRLETRERYYLIDIHRDLLDDIVIYCAWGSKFTQQGNRRLIKVETWRDGLKMIDGIIKRRYQHGYTLVNERVYEALPTKR